MWRPCAAYDFNYEGLGEARSAVERAHGCRSWVVVREALKEDLGGSQRDVAVPPGEPIRLEVVAPPRTRAPDRLGADPVHLDATCSATWHRDLDLIIDIVNAPDARSAVPPEPVLRGYAVDADLDVRWGDPVDIRDLETAGGMISVRHRTAMSTSHALLIIGLNTLSHKSFIHN